MEIRNADDARQVLEATRGVLCRLLKRPIGKRGGGAEVPHPARHVADSLPGLAIDDAAAADLLSVLGVDEG